EAPTVFVARLTITAFDVLPSELLTYIVAPSGEIASLTTPPGMASDAPAVFVATLIGVTVPSPLFAVHAVVPSGVIAISVGHLPTVMAGPVVLVGVLIGVTVLVLRFAT